MTDETTAKFQFWVKLILPLVVIVGSVVVTAAVTTNMNQKDILRIETRGTIQAQKNTERIGVLESLISSQTSMMNEMRGDIKVLLGRGAE